MTNETLNDDDELLNRQMTEVFDIQCYFLLDHKFLFFIWFKNGQVEMVIYE